MQFDPSNFETRFWIDRLNSSNFAKAPAFPKLYPSLCKGASFSKVLSPKLWTAAFGETILNARCPRWSAFKRNFWLKLCIEAEVWFLYFY